MVDKFQFKQSLQEEERVEREEKVLYHLEDVQKQLDNIDKDRYKYRVYV